MYKIAVIEDLQPTNDEFKSFLLRIWPDSKVSQFTNCESALQAIAENTFDLVISDIDLGAGSDKYGGAKIAKALDGTQIPLLIVSGAPQPELHRDFFKALDAWDYLQKPVTESDFRTQVVRAITFKNAQSDSSVLKGCIAGDERLTINPLNKVKVTWNGKRVNISITQIRLLQIIAANCGFDTTFEEMFACIDSGTNKENLRVHIGQIRSAFKEVDETFDCIRAVPMVGYRWDI